MSYTPKNKIYFSFFMFTADLQPDNKEYTKTLISHLKALAQMGYDGFDMHIAANPLSVSHHSEVESYKNLKLAFDEAGFKDFGFATNVGTTQVFDPTSPYQQQRQQALAYLKSRVDITSILAGGQETIMSGPFLYPYGVFPLTDSGAPIWSDALQNWLKPRYEAAYHVFEDLSKYANEKGVKLAIEPVKSWETPGPNQVSDALDFIDAARLSWPCGVTMDTAQVVMESVGPSVFNNNVDRAAAIGGLYYIHISPPDRGAVKDSWIPWNILLPKLLPVFTGPYLVEVFNAIPPFDSSMRMSRPRFWRPGEDEPTTAKSAYMVAEEGLKELKDQLAYYSKTLSPITVPTLPEPIKILVKHQGDVRIHTFISAYTDDNIANATHIIESKNVLVVIDGQFLNTYAKKFRAYTDSLNKPIKRVYVSHRHPDHWFGLTEGFEDIQEHIYALAETKGFIETDGEISRKDHEEKLGDECPAKVTAPKHVVEPGEEIVDGVRYIFDRVTETEIDFLLTIKLPDLGVYIVQDLIYSGTHLYLTKQMPHWIKILQDMLLSDYELFLPGHGIPADKKEVAANIEYLAAAKEAFDNGLKDEDFKSFMIQRYPARLCPGIFNIYEPRLFDGAGDY
jgi:glyoxylase-like metal-dependent hydrolase (beta-lactamase superfamily II)/sugar phosphate isomerase/epimerase